MDHLDSRGELEMVVRDPPTELPGEQYQSGPKPLSAQAESVLRQSMDEWILAGQLLSQQFVDFAQLISHNGIKRSQLSWSGVRSLNGLAHQILPCCR
jgi:hypothetical protein